MKHFFKLVCLAAVIAAGVFIAPSLKKQTKTTASNYASIVKER